MSYTPYRPQPKYTTETHQPYTPKIYQPWPRNQQTNNKLNPPKFIDNNYGRVMTEGSIPNNKPITPIYNQPNYPPNNQINKMNANELFKSSIYTNPQNGNQTVNERYLNNSGGGKINITPPRKLPRVSQPLLSSNSEIPLNITQNPKHPNTETSIYSHERQTSFTKTKSVQTQQQKVQMLEGIRDPKKSNSIYNSEKIVKANIQTPRVENSKKKITVDDFIVIKQLGSGKYGRVSLVRQKWSGFICALKVIEKKLLVEEEITDQFIRELKIQIYLNHPHIIKMYGFFNDTDNFYTILEVATGGQLFHMLKKSQSLPQVKVAGIMRQVCQAVSQIHSQRIIHRDIKPQNIVLHDGVIKLCDFGWSVHQDKNLRTTFCGTPLYVCPQILKGKQYDQKIDIWSLGIMMYEMLVGENPFRITKEEELIKIIKDEIVIPSYTNISKQAKEFLDKCLKKNPNQRYNIRQLSEHQFFKKYPQKQSEKKMKFE